MSIPREQIALSKLGEWRNIQPVLYQIVQEVQQRVNANILKEHDVVVSEIEDYWIANRGFIRRLSIPYANHEAVVIPPGTPLYTDAVGGGKKAKADAAATADAIGLVADQGIAPGVVGTLCTFGALELTITQWDAIAGTTGGLTFNTRYYLDPATAGKITATAPVTPGQFVVEIGIAVSTTLLNVCPSTPYML